MELLEKLIEKSQFGELPDILITAETNKMLQEIESNIMQQGLKFEEYLAHLGKTRDQLILDFVPQAIKRVKSALLTRSLFFQEKFEISEAEVDLEIEAFTRAYASNPEIAKNFKTPEYRDYVRNLIGNRKVMELLKTTCIERTNLNHQC